MADSLNPKQQRFVDEYLVDLNATQAAQRAGYSARTARSIGQRLLTNVAIQAAVRAGEQARAERTEVTQDYVLRRLKENVDRAMDGDTYQGAVANGALALLGKHLGMFVDRHSVENPDGSPLRFTFAMGRTLESDDTEDAA